MEYPPEKKKKKIHVCGCYFFEHIRTKTPHKTYMQHGLAMKSLTGSRKVVEVLNRLGHCVSYSVTEELETELTYEANNNNDVTPFGMDRCPDRGIGVAWDNFDGYAETEDGESTLHDTVGIAYQANRNENISPDNQIGPSSVPANSNYEQTNSNKSMNQHQNVNSPENSSNSNGQYKTHL